ncbi:MAG: cupin domain-containing protein [Chloroflexi bacterium]|nr:cupin domain-containing protein [Chloroflexota bacterium]
MEEMSKANSPDIWRRRQVLLHELGLIENEINRRRQQDRHLVRAEDLVWEKSSASQPRKAEADEAETYCRVVSPDVGFNIHNFRIFITQGAPHTSRGRYHTHGEAVKYYLSGRAIEYVGENEYQVKAGDFVFIPANTWHGTQNPYDEPVKVMAIQQMPGTSLQVPAPYIYRADELDT